ncbi:UDP-glucuronate:xylan alpha-glucuronosyltransferase 1 [Camellia lanceoleosa]|uniref:UDP-glucuronate:xylan alpha-glucuronosyltransferase 1 n=1 Tax=Camellia lanceoleosa TaxID=1840588 RepID=A0ACC0IYG1_9ERIC|nr:UDP-glucuronate:xylan alpha-glucuronosyltransferase 1 [Camellia lanceoleosa]
MEARQRSISIEDIYKRRLQRSKVQDVEKPFHIPIQDKSAKWKFHHLKLVLAIIIFCTFITILYSPTTHHHDHISQAVSRLSTFFQHLDHVQRKVTWDSLYPEWIDEEEEEEIPVCPTLPKVQVPRIRKQLDLIVVKLPCRDEGNWSRDVARLHLQLAAAQLAIAPVSAKANNHPLHLLFVTKGFPIPNLFICKELVLREGNTWLYKPNLNALREKLQLPVGSCQLALPLKPNKEKQEVESERKVHHHREAYATILHSAHVYVCGAIVAAQSIRMAGSTRDLIILVDDTISEYHRSGLEAAGWKIRTIQRIRNPKAEKDAYNEWNYSKFRLWQLTDYDKIIFIDADMLILRNIDFLFHMPEISATGNNGTLFNSGVMVIEPSDCTFKLLMDHINEIESYNGGDQGYLNEIFTWWHRIPKHMNYLKNFWVGDDEAVKQKKTKLFGAEPPILYVLHYLGLKPWLCFRDYDCNWNADIFHEFASDVAHNKWWRVHDAMPQQLQQFCLLKSKQKAQLEWDRMQAEKENYTDGHWRNQIKDWRLNKCIDNFCSWESMLRHWGETNWTDDEFFNPSPPAITMTSLSGL